MRPSSSASSISFVNRPLPPGLEQAAVLDAVAAGGDQHQRGDGLGRLGRRAERGGDRPLHLPRLGAGELRRAGPDADHALRLQQPAPQGQTPRSISRLHRLRRFPLPRSAGRETLTPVAAAGVAAGAAEAAAGDGAAVVDGPRGRRACARRAGRRRARRRCGRPACGRRRPGDARSRRRRAWKSGRRGRGSSRCRVAAVSAAHVAEHHAGEEGMKKLPRRCGRVSHRPSPYSASQAALSP